MGKSVEIAREIFDAGTGRRYDVSDPAEIRAATEAFLAALPKRELGPLAPGPPARADTPALDRPVDHALPASERLDALVQGCDYRGVVLARTSCKCTGQWHCLLGLGDDPARPHQVTVHRCYQCVLGQIPGVWPDPPPPRQSDVAGPGMLRRAGNFARAAARYVAAGAPRADAEEASRRLAICRANSCGFCRDDVCRHPACGCYLPEKTAWGTESCPLDPPLWGAAT